MYLRKPQLGVLSAEKHELGAFQKKVLPCEIWGSECHQGQERTSSSCLLKEEEREFDCERCLPSPERVISGAATEARELFR